MAVLVDAVAATAEGVEVAVIKYNDISPRHLLLWLSLFNSSCVIANEPPMNRQNELLNMLKHDCGSCHGLTLKGGLGPPLLPKDLINKPTDYLIDTIQNGRKGTAMPPWKTFISEQETRWLVQSQLKLKKAK